MKNLSLNEKKYKALQGTIPEKIIGIKQTNKNSSKIEEDPKKLWCQLYVIFGCFEQNVHFKKDTKHQALSPDNFNIF